MVALNSCSNFDSIIKEIEGKYGKGFINQMEKDKEAVKVINTGSLSLNKAIGVGGYPVGKIIEIYGPESCGKTTLALQACAQAQKDGSKVAYIDLENSIDKKYCEANGIDLSNMLIIQPENGEQMFDIIESLVKSNQIKLIVIDSVAAIVPKSETSGDMEDQTIGLAARLMSKGLRILQNLMIGSETTIIFINQLREKIGVMFANPETTTGGRALKFYASLRIEVRRNELLKSGSDIIGIKTCAKIVKNKLAAPLTKAMIDIYFSKGFDHNAEIIDFAIESGKIEKRGSWFFLKEERIAQGYDNVKKYFENNTEAFNNLKKEVLA